tara:strand:- start:1304 stop:1492 length:189 start_codon:yes stop_codon:yes gene_type:complete
MKIKARLNKIYRISSNSVKCSTSEFNKLKDGETVEMAEKSAKQLLNMGVVEMSKNKTKKESK